MELSERVHEERLFRKKYSFRPKISDSTLGKGYWMSSKFGWGYWDFNRSWDSAYGARRPYSVNPFSWLLSYWLIRMQCYGTGRVGWPFAPMVHIWFILIGSVRALNLHKYGSSVLKAYNPVYIYRYFQMRGNSADSWTVLGGIMLSVTGIEALYADLCHFPVLSIQVYKEEREEQQSRMGLVALTPMTNNI